MIDTPGHRTFTVLVLCVLLFGLFVWYGSLSPAPQLHAYPGTGELHPDYERYVGHHAEIAGTIIGVDPVTIEVAHDYGVETYVLRNAPSVDVGQEVWAFVTVEPEGTLYTENTIVRDPWEITYLYAISVVGIVWVLVRSVRHWRFNWRQFALVPLATPPPPQLQDQRIPQGDGEGDG